VTIALLAIAASVPTAVGTALLLVRHACSSRVDGDEIARVAVATSPTGDLRVNL
jgi:hypothetical protein